MELKREQEYLFLRTIERLEHLPYRWGGDDPDSGFDCSGMVVWGLQAVGLMRDGEDATANDLWLKYSPKYQHAGPTRGALAFWFDGTGKAYHVAVCISSNFCLTAHRGGSKTNSREDAQAQNAYICIRPIDHRVSKPKFVYLWQ